MPDFVEIAVIFALFLTVLLGRDDNIYSGRKRESNDFRCVIATISQKILGVYSIDKVYMKSFMLIIVMNGSRRAKGLPEIQSALCNCH